MPSSQQRSILKLPENVTEGVLVGSTSADSVARKAGLRKYDVIVSINDKKIKNIADLHTKLYSYAVGDTIKVQFYRDGKLQSVDVKLTKTT